MKTSNAFNPRRILCPMDLSDLSTLALKYAAVGARAFQAELTILYAIHFDLPPYFTRAQTGQFTRQLKEAQRAARAHLVAHVGRTLGRGFREIPIRYLILERHPADAILETVEKGGYDLVVMGTHGRTAASRFLLGSVTKNVTQHARSPVFIVRQKQHEFIDANEPEALPRLERILCPVNYTDAARSSLAQAASLAQRFNATLQVLYTVEPGDRQSSSQATSELCAWIPKTVAVQCTVQPLVRRGRAAEQIVKFAADHKQDLIVLGAQARQRLTSVLFGETTDLVIRHAPVPVLVLPQPALGS